MQDMTEQDVQYVKRIQYLEYKLDVVFRALTVLTEEFNKEERDQDGFEVM